MLFRSLKSDKGLKHNCTKRFNSNNKKISEEQNYLDNFQDKSNIRINLQDRIVEIFSLLKSEVLKSTWHLIKNSTMGLIVGVIIGSGMFLFSTKSLMLVAISFGATTVLMASLGIVRGISKIVSNLTEKDGILHQFISLIFDFAFQSIKNTTSVDVGKEIIPIEMYNTSIRTSIKMIEDKLSFDNWFIKKFIKIFTGRMEDSLLRFTKDKKDVDVMGSRDLLASMVLEELKGMISNKLSLSIYSISFFQFLLILLLL